MRPQDRARQLRPMIIEAAASLSDGDAVDAVELFEAWQAGKSYEVSDQRIRYGDKLYRCVQAHTSQEGWEPPAVPALWTEVAKPGEIPVWKQPTGAQDAYQMGDKVRYPDEHGTVWTSEINDNIWRPGVYGWVED